MKLQLLAVALAGALSQSVFAQDIAIESEKDKLSYGAEAAAAEAKASAAEARAAGEKFLAENAARDGVIVTASGLQYEVVEAAEGAKPAVEDTVTVHYSGTLIDGTVFDSSYQRGEPFDFQVRGVIPGWTEGLQLMSVGSKFRFVIPSELAYGERLPALHL